MPESHRLTFVDPFRVMQSGGHPEEFDLVEQTCSPRATRGSRSARYRPA